MSLDFPYYEQLRRRRHPAAIWWRVGDVLYYLGLLAMFVAIPAASIGLNRAFVGAGRSLSWAAFGAGIGGACAFAVGCLAKGRAHEMGARDGILP